MNEIYDENLYNIISQFGPEETLIRVRASHESYISKFGISFLSKKGCVNPPTHCEDVLDQLWDERVYPKLRNIHSGKQGEKVRGLSAWLIDGMKWTIIDHVSKNCRVKSLAFEDCENETATHNNPEIIYIQQESKREKAKIGSLALAHLTEIERTVLELKYGHKFSHKQISTHLNISEVNSKQICSRALAKAGSFVGRIRSNK